VGGLCGGDAVLIEEASGFPWNGWCIYNNGFADFKTGLYWNYLKRLKGELEKADLKDTQFYRWVRRRLEEIEYMWRKIIRE